MAVNKVIYDGNTLIDLTSDTVSANDVLAGTTFHLPSGAPSVGTLAPVMDVTVDDVSIVEDGVAKIDSDEFGKVDDVYVNGVSVVSSKIANVKTHKEVTQAQYDALPSTKESDDIIYMITDASTIEHCVIELTQAQYDALPATKDSDNNVYVITDRGLAGDAELVDYDNTDSGLSADNVQDALDEIVDEKVNKTTTVNGKALSGNVTLYGTDIALSSNDARTIGNVAGLTYTVVSPWR